MEELHLWLLAASMWLEDAEYYLSMGFWALAGALLGLSVIHSSKSCGNSLAMFR